ncbi:MAG: hypothetical protein AB1589_18865 [Cyanobacteriota bacterium]
MQDKDSKPILMSKFPPIESQVNRSDKSPSTMPLALHISTQVLLGKKIEISVPQLSAGDAVDVLIIPSNTSCHPCHSMSNQLEGIPLSPKKHNNGQHRESDHIAVAIEALESVEDYLCPAPGSLLEEMLNDALEGRIRVEAMDIQDRMLVQHHAKKYIEQAIATLQRLLQ